MQRSTKARGEGVSRLMPDPCCTLQVHTTAEHKTHKERGKGQRQGPEGQKPGRRRRKDRSNGGGSGHGQAIVVPSRALAPGLGVRRGLEGVKLSINGPFDMEN